MAHQNPYAPPISEVRDGSQGELQGRRIGAMIFTVVGSLPAVLILFVLLTTSKDLVPDASWAIASALFLPAIPIGAWQGRAL